MQLIGPYVTENMGDGEHGRGAHPAHPVPAARLARLRRPHPARPPRRGTTARQGETALFPTACYSNVQPGTLWHRELLCFVPRFAVEAVEYLLTDTVVARAPCTRLLVWMLEQEEAAALRGVLHARVECLQQMLGGHTLTQAKVSVRYYHPHSITFREKTEQLTHSIDRIRVVIFGTPPGWCTKYHDTYSVYAGG